MEHLQYKTEKKRIEIIEQMKFILDKEKDVISYGNFLYLPEKIEIDQNLPQHEKSKRFKYLFLS